MAASLTPGETQSLLERFGYCYDSLIHRIELVLPRRGQPLRQVHIDIETREKALRWGLLHLSVVHLEHFRMRLPPHYDFEVIYDGIYIGWEGDGSVRLDLSPGVDYRNGPNGNEPPSPDHESPCYFVGRELSWEFQPYPA
ncbi:hypothetical protein ATI61_10641 [Archangium gephyra]|uniref:Uncharacterized protein n=1 Tax=Archangium gephyra TaxID=48 RepID=A0AAC8Q0G1_9BACT|nr:hypothetical protein [Archangium gephyra]AKI98640.1 Hypothetical protein AA314_00267 [Archangium gephyra]REG30572.1 hypothetical protein ATI61_10641 [Archangium gephyra]